ncbi:hypothetical protein SAMN05216228_10401 [Rhizobium tibeticum]|nr:hypothetical protein SAMN05216228_10401 [Rhizobium tibeticum]
MRGLWQSNLQGVNWLDVFYLLTAGVAVAFSETRYTTSSVT